MKRQNFGRNGKITQQPVVHFETEKLSKETESAEGLYVV